MYFYNNVLTIPWHGSCPNLCDFSGCLWLWMSLKNIGDTFGSDSVNLGLHALPYLWFLEFQIYLEYCSTMWDINEKFKRCLVKVHQHLHHIAVRFAALRIDHISGNLCSQSYDFYYLHLHSHWKIIYLAIPKYIGANCIFIICVRTGMWRPDSVFQ